MHPRNEPSAAVVSEPARPTPAHEYPKNVKPNVVCVGAGVANLWTMIRLKRLRPETDILMFDKSVEGTHTHTLIIGEEAFQDCHTDDELKTLVKTIPGKIRIHELRKILLDYAQSLGIKIEYYPVTSCDALIKRFPSASVIMGGDGAYSIVHREMFNAEFSYKKTHNYVAFLRYEVEGKTKKLTPVLKTFPALAQSNHLVFEVVSKEFEGKTQVSLQIFINQKTFEKLNVAKKAKTLTYQSLANLDADLWDTVRTWRGEREKYLKEVATPNSESFSATHLTVYCTQEFVKNLPGKRVIVDGDARLGLIYFRGITVSMMCSLKLATATANFLELEKKHGAAATWVEEDPFKEYKSFMKKVAKDEGINAQWKNFGVKTLQFSAMSLQTPPMRASIMSSVAVKTHIEEGSRKSMQKISEVVSKKEESSGCRIM